MPAATKQIVFDGLEFTAKPVKKPDVVYFTHESPEFEVTLYNNDSKYEWAEESQFTWAIDISPKGVVHSDTVEFGPLDYGEEVSFTVGGEVLSYDGHGVLGVAAGSASGRGGSDRRALNSRKARDAKPVYSFSVWDKSIYDASVRQPKRLQKYLIITTIALIVFAVIQIRLAAF